MSHLVDDIFSLYRRKGSRIYGRESVSQLLHALQCAQIAERHGADAAMISAALLHDYGHLVGTRDEALLQQGEHVWHAAVGARLLSRIFPASVTEPIRLHVMAKRHLCATDPRYFEALSQGSLVTLKDQGGILSAHETSAFLAEPHADAAILLRRWDDHAQDPEAETPPLEYFRRYLCEALTPRSVAAF